MKIEVQNNLNIIIMFMSAFPSYNQNLTMCNCKMYEKDIIDSCWQQFFKFIPCISLAGFVFVDSLCPSQKFSSHVRMGRLS